MTDFAALQDFHRVVGFQGLGAASRATGRPKSSLARRIGKLEGELGVRLIERTRAGFRLTEAGSALHRQTMPLLHELDLACTSVARDALSLQGTLRVSVPALFADAVMGELSAKFLQAYPKLSIELVGDDRVVDLADERFDVVVRVNPDPDSSLVGRRFGISSRALVASPHVPWPTAEIPSFPALVAFPQESLSWIVEHDGQLLEAEPDIRLRTSSLITMRDAAIAGLGAAQLPMFLVGRDLRSGRLVRWGPASSPDVELWVLHTSTRHASRKVGAFVQFLCANAPSLMEEYSARQG